ncbi:MAG: hypothetical protein ACE5JE_02270 [Thermoplasmata archaeon]
MARPVGVTILAILAILVAILLFIGGATSLLVTAMPGLTPEQVQLIQALGAVSLVLGILYLVGGIGLFRLTLWGWWLAVLASLVTVVSNVTQVVIDPGLLLGSTPGLVLALIILGYLFVVRDHFGTGS